MPTMKFTDATVRNLKTTDSRYEVREDSAHGNGTLAIRVSKNGTKVWQFLYTFDGRDRRMTLGTYPAMTVADAHAARGLAMQLRQQGKDPGAMAVKEHVAERAAPTFADLADKFLVEHARIRKAAKSVASDERILKHDLLPKLGPHKADAIERNEVEGLVRSIADRGAPIQANRTLALVRKIYNWGLGRALVRQNPCVRIEPPGKETQRDRWLTDSEVQTFLVNLKTAEMAKESRLALRFQLLTAQRCGEVLGLQWSEIDKVSAVWTIPAHKAKNRKSHRVPLSAQALAVLDEAKALNPDRATVFPSPRGDKPMVETAVCRALHRNLTATAPGVLPQIDLPPFTPHDLRRTAASQMTSMGISRLVVSKILNHADVGVTAIYDRTSYDIDKRAALNAWGRRVAELEAAKASGLDLASEATQAGGA